jgi:hypothetical protein
MNRRIPSIKVALKGKGDIPINLIRNITARTQSNEEEVTHLTVLS